MSAPIIVPEWSLHVGDCRLVLPRLPARCCAAMVTDPPSGLGFMGLAWDLARAEVFAALLAEAFAEALRVLQEGAWVLVWAHPATSHWTAVALERAGYTIETKIPWINAEAKPQPWRVGRLAPGHEEWILARAPGSRRPLSMRLWRDAGGGRHPRGLIIGRGAGELLDVAVGRRASGQKAGGAVKTAERRNSYGGFSGSYEEKAYKASDGGPSRFFPDEGRLLAVYGPRARHRKHRQLGPGGRESEHPTPKSTELLLPLVDLVAGEEAGDGPVLDIFAGSGAVGEAAMLLGRGFVGVELGEDPRWPAEARERLQATARHLARREPASRQASIFTGEPAS